jgi:hypothetical protein
MKAEIYWIQGPWTGRLAIMPRPRGGEWLEDEVRDWRAAGIDIVVSTLTTEETEELDLTNEAALCQAVGIEYVGFPIRDRGVPFSFPATVELLRYLDGDLTEGKNVAIHCRQGVGRSALLAAGLLVVAGVDPEAAIKRVGAARGCPVPETAEQREWVAKFSRGLFAESRKSRGCSEEESTRVWGRVLNFSRIHDARASAAGHYSRRGPGVSARPR